MIAAELNVRDEPSTSAERVETVDRGSVFLLGGYEPTSADGYVWWRASEVINLVDGDLPSFPANVHASGVAGWIATAKGTTPYVEVLAPRCPATVDLAHVSAMLGGERAHCFAERDLTLTGTLTCGPCEGIGPLEKYEPRWLADESYAWLAPPRSAWGLQLHVPPEVAPDGVEALRETRVLDGGMILRVVGHFNDSRSASCEIALYVDDDTLAPIADRYAEQACRQEFVVERFEVLGIDPEYEPPF